MPSNADTLHHVVPDTRATQVRTGFGRRSRDRDGLVMLTLYAVALFAIPSRLIFGPLGGAGTPATLIGLAALLWWTWTWLAQAGDRTPSARPVRRAFLAFVAAALVSYVAGALRPISGVELNSSETGLLILLSWLGVLTVATDGMADRGQLRVLVERLALLGGAVALLGIVQFATGRPFTNYIQIPGLTVNSSLDSVLDRGGFNRPAGTALHPIEFGTVLTILLPLCLHVAFTSELSRFRRWWPVAATCIAIPLSISRSAIIGTVVVLAILVPSWTPKVRRGALALGALGATGLFVAVPGFLGTFVNLFAGVKGDSSALSRSNSYGLALEFVQRAPLTGRGYLTFLPRYRILDNQYLGLLIDTGIFGLAAMLGIFVTAIAVCVRLRRRSVDAPVRSLALALAAGISAAAAGFAFFDALSFPMFASMTFLTVALASSLWRLEGGSDRG